MKNTMLGLLLVLFVSACSHKTESDVAAVAQAKAVAQKSAEQWLALIDAGNYAESWRNASGLFQAAVPQEQWERKVAAVRQPLGNLVARQLKSAQYAKSLPGAPDGNYVVFQFDTAFANKQAAVETITPKLDADGTWKVSGYYIK